MPSASVKSTFTLHEAVVISGFSKYMLDYLARENIFAPSCSDRTGRGVRRRYSYEDLVLLRVLRKICASNGKIRHLKAALLEFRAQFGPLKPGQRVDHVLFVQGNELCVFSAAEGGRQIRTGQRTFSFVVDLSEVANEVSECVVFEPKTRNFKLTAEIALRVEEERQRLWLETKMRRTAKASMG